MNLKYLSAAHDLNCYQADTAIKCRRLEKHCIANYCNILNLCKEIPGHKYDRKKFIKVLGEVDVVFKDEDEDSGINESDSSSN